jgi:hypothetical protein
MDVSTLFNNSLITLISNISLIEDLSLSESEATEDSYESIEIVEFSLA